MPETAPILNGLLPPPTHVQILVGWNKIILNDCSSSTGYNLKEELLTVFLTQTKTKAEECANYFQKFSTFLIRPKPLLWKQYQQYELLHFQQLERDGAYIVCYEHVGYLADISSTMRSFRWKPVLPLTTHLGAHLSLSLLIKRQNPLSCSMRHMFNAICAALSTMLPFFHSLSAPRSLHSKRSQCFGCHLISPQLGNSHDHE